MASQIQLRRDTAANWTSVNPLLAQGEAGFELVTNKLKIGDGSTLWNSLPYITTGGGGGITSLNGLTGASQTFVNDTNVVVVSSGSTHSLGFSGQLSLARGGTGANLTAVNGGVIYSTASGFGITAAGSSGQVLKSNGAAPPTWITVSGTGTVTSVGLSLPGIFTVSGSPVTAAGTLTASLASQTANQVFVAPNGAPGAPTFRALVTGDLPTASTILDTVGATQGQILYRNATNWTVLSPGTSGQVLQTNGAGANPSWVTPSGGGGGITSLNGLTGATQTFTNDTNVTVTSGGSAHVLGWSGQLSIARGGSGQSTANAALNAFLPTQTGNSGKFLTTDGSNTSWATAGSGGASVQYVAFGALATGYATLQVYGTTSDVAAITLIKSVNTVTIGSVSGTAKLIALTVQFAASDITAGTASIVYPEVNSQTTLNNTFIPTVVRASAAGAQSTTAFTTANSSGTITLSCSGLTNAAVNFVKVVF